MDKSEHPQSDEPEKGNGKETLPEKTIGVILRDERKKKRLSYAQISEITRLRPSILEALENESWSDLPSPAFARGFICSYGAALGLEEKKLTALYHASDPAKVSAPKPLAEPTKRKKISFLVLIFILLASISSYYLWKGYSAQQPVILVPEKNSPTKSPAENTEKKPNVLKSRLKDMPNEQGQTEPDPAITPESGLIKQADVFVDEENKPVTNNSTAAAVESALPEFTLKADVREETWVKIFIDDEDPREFLFRPGKHYEWKAKKGFELMIGNAGGIDLEFNGQAVAKPATPGRVVKLILPENYERTVYE